MSEKQESKSVSSESYSESESNSKSSVEKDEGKGSMSDDDSALKSVEYIQEDGKEKKIVKYKYCCKLCKHPDKSKKACVCVVPLSQRRADLGQGGCRNCGCKGCSKQDYISKGEDPQYHPELKQVKQGKEDKEKVVPPKKVQVKQKKQDRREKIREPSRQKQRDRGRQRQRERQRERDNSRSRKHKVSPKRNKKKASESRSRSPQIIDTFSLKFHNFDRSILGSVLINEYQVNPTILGFAIPQRTYSYIFGKPR